MKNKTLWWILCVAAVLAVTAGIRTLAQDGGVGNGTPAHFSGVINDYTPVSSGLSSPWELRGPWSLRLNDESGTADFSASLTMELSDFGQSLASVNAVTRLQHTHHITMKDAVVTYNPADCPPGSGGPPYTARIEVSGTASVFANGSAAPFGLHSPLQVCIDGGPDVAYSNVTLVFQKPATTHFGSQPIRGVVKKATWLDD